MECIGVCRMEQFTGETTIIIIIVKNHGFQMVSCRLTLKQINSEFVASEMHHCSAVILDDLGKAMEDTL